jgi:hypothetical protein
LLKEEEEEEEEEEEKELELSEEVAVGPSSGAKSERRARV